MHAPIRTAPRRAEPALPTRPGIRQRLRRAIGPLRLVVGGWHPRLATASNGRARAQDAIVVALSAGEELYGTTDELAAQLGVRPAHLFHAMLDLVAVGWLTISTDREIRHRLAWAEPVQQAIEAEAVAAA